MPLPSQLTVQSVLRLLEAHFNHQYKTSGASRLPVLALYAVYQSLMVLPRYEDKILAPLKSQTTADTKSHSIGDIEIVDSDGQFFEALEIKHGKPIDFGMVQIAFDKIKNLPISRYYLLTTNTPNTTQAQEIETLCAKILIQHGCEIIVNGVMPTFKYYLRLLPNLSDFVNNYTSILQTEFASGAIKAVHIQKWDALLDENNP
jgi:DNA (cytosine-5)-methyltransferase 1